MPQRRQLAAIGHAVDLSAYSNHVAAQITRLLNSVDADLFRAIAEALDQMPVSTFNMRRLQAMLASVRAINANAYTLVGDYLSAEMESFLLAEIAFGTRTIGTVDGLPPKLVTVEQAWAAATREPIRGRLMKDWAGTLAQGRANRIQQSLAIAYVEGRTIPEMTRALRGTRAAGYADGLLQIDRRAAEAIARTTTAHFASSARDAVFEKNKDRIDYIVWLSVLDTRTSAICQIRDGEHYTVDGQPIDHNLPWLGGPGKAHWNCRSTAYAETKGKVLDLSAGRVRSSMDGPVSSKVTFADWIEKQTAERQREVLGASRARLMREGHYKLPQMYDNRGRLLTLEQLRSRDEQTFKELGL
jgi:SPP1 gp7 family putative phage head morphogenesis protein